MNTIADELAAIGASAPTGAWGDVPPSDSTPASLWADVRRLTAENAALRADAERYRWLREFRPGRVQVILIDDFQGDEILSDDRLDAAIDAAMKDHP
jgi:hypothetical protein